MADASTVQIPEDLVKVATDKGISLDLVRRALALGFPADAIKGQMSQPNVDAAAAEAFIAEQERIRAGGEITIPPELAAVAKEHKWPDDILKRALKLGAPVEMMINQIKAGISPEQAEAFIVIQEQMTSGQERVLDLQWMKVPTEWGIRVKPGKKGLTVGMINVGTYADVPDYWPYQTEMPRGAYPIPGVPSMGYSIYDKAELWAENSADLYEEAIQRRWRASWDIPWNTLQPLPDPIERSFCQLATALCEMGLVVGDTIGKWLPEMSYGYHEVKLYLSAAEFDEARQFEVFRKRAFSNGGGMGVQSPGYFHRGIIDCRYWTETSCSMFILLNSYIMGLYEMGLYSANSECDAAIFTKCMQDKARQMAYGIQHLKYFLSRKLDRREEIAHSLNKAEAIFAYEIEKDVPLKEAMIVLLGGGTSPEQQADGAAKYEYFWGRWVNRYAGRLAAAGLERRDKLHTSLRKYIYQPEAAAAAA